MGFGHCSVKQQVEVLISSALYVLTGVGSFCALISANTFFYEVTS
jgi:hypothetical protein